MHWRLVGTVILGSTLGTTKIKSNLNTGQYTGSVPSDHSQGQAMVEPLLLPGITRYINKFFWKATQKRGGGLHTHTSGFDCDWLKVVIVREVISSVFCSLSLCCCSACLSGVVFVVALSKSVHNCCVPYQALTSVPGAQGQSIRPPPVPCQADGLQGRGEINAG